MSRIHEIPVVVVNDAPTGSRPAHSTPSVVLALLNEIETKLDALATGGEDSTIDLRWLSGMPQEFDLLRKTLGEGEVAATITSVGSTVVQETAIPCVWWVTHRDYDGTRLGEFVEITDAPEILRSDRLAIPKGLAELRCRSARIDTPDLFSSTLAMQGS